MTATATTETASESVSESDANIARLPFVEGVRGYAALMVVVGHVAHGSYRLLGDESFFQASWADRLFWPGWAANQMVYLFLMVSGFSLFYSEDVRRTVTGTSTSLSVFARRRLWRIVPTYYVALAFGLLVLAVVPWRLIDGVPSLGPEPVTLSGVLAHLGFVHNFRREWLYQGSGPLWSLAFEVQLYLLFPILYAAARRYSVVLVAGSAIVLDVLIHQGSPDLFVLGMLRWFALGMLVAGIYRHPLVRRVPATWVVAAGSALVIIGYLRLGPLSGGLKQDFVWAGGFALLLVGMAQAPASRLNPFNGRAIRWLGLRSYSLYAFHFPVLWLVYAALSSAGAEGAPMALLLAAVGIPLSIALSAVAYHAVERPALRRVKAIR